MPEGIRLTIPRSKTDQEGEGLVKAIFFGKESQTCPVRALRSWLRASGITSGPVFRGIGRHGHLREGALAGYSIARIIKKRAKAAGLDAEEVSGHSLRSGFITQAARQGAQERKIMRHSGHKDLRTVREYIHEGEIFGKGAPGRDIGL